MMLFFVHRGYMWIDRPMSIDIDLLVKITCLSSQGKDPTSLFFDNKNEKILFESMEYKFHTLHRHHGLDVASIYDLGVRFATQVLSCKLLRKCKKDQVPTMIRVTEK
jgi:hypothetical protein